MIAASYPRRQRNRRMLRALEHAGVAVAFLLLAALCASSGLTSLAIALLAASAVFAVLSRRWFDLAKRSAIGAASEERVRRLLASLEREGWQIRHSLRWSSGGDIDHVAIAPAAVGVAFVIETKTRGYRPGDLARITDIAHWLTRRRGGWCRRGAVPVVCLAGLRGVERWEQGVLVVSADRLLPLLARHAGTTRKPLFLR